MSDTVIHGIGWASQPDLLIRCTQEWTTPEWRQPVLPVNVYLACNGMLYTFDPETVTCDACRRQRERKSNGEG